MSVLIVAAIVIGLLVTTSWLVATRRNAVFAWDYAALLSPVPIWYALAVVGVGSNSMGNLLEIPVVLLGAAIVFSLRVFAFDRVVGSAQEASRLAFIATFLLVVIVRLFAPEMPE